MVEYHCKYPKGSSSKLQINNRLMAGLQAYYGSKTFNRDDLLKVFFDKIHKTGKNITKRKETDHEALSPQY